MAGACGANCFPEGRGVARRGAPRDLLACLLPAALCLAAFWPVFAGRVLVPSDGVYLIDRAFVQSRPADLPDRMNVTLTPDQVYVFYVWRQFAAESVRAGRIPLWNPYVGCGAPFLANNQSAVLNPANLVLNQVLSPARAQTAFGLLTLLAACLFAYSLVRSLGASPLGGIRAGLTFGLGGFTFIWLGYPLAGAAVWLPALLWITHRIAGRPTLGGAALIGGIIGWQFLAGHLSTSVQTLAFWLVFAGYEYQLRRKAQGRVWKAQFWGALALGLALGVGLAAPMLAPVAEYFDLSAISRTGRSRWVSANASENVSRALFGDRWFLTSIAPGEAALLFLPEARGNPAFGDYRPFSGYGNYAECAGYVGTVALLALLLGLTRRPSPGYHRFFLIAAGAMLGVLLHLPGFNLVPYLPIIRLTSPTRLRFIFSLCAAVVVALSVSEWFPARPAPTRPRRLPLWIVALALVAVQAGLAGSAWTALSAHWRDLSGSDLWLRVAKLLAPPLAAAVLAGLLFLGARRTRWTAALAVGLVAVSFLDLLLFGARWHVTARANAVLPDLP